MNESIHTQERWNETEMDPENVQADDLGNFYRWMPEDKRRNAANMSSVNEEQRAAIQELLTGDTVEKVVDRPAVGTAQFFQLIDMIMEEMKIMDTIAKLVTEWNNPKQKEIAELRERAAALDSDTQADEIKKIAKQVFALQKPQNKTEAIAPLNDALLPVYLRMRRLGYSHKDLTS